VADGAQGPGRQYAGIIGAFRSSTISSTVTMQRLAASAGFFLYAKDAPEQHVAFTVGFLSMNHRDIRAHRRHRRQHFASERASERFDQRLTFGKSEPA